MRLRAFTCAVLGQEHTPFLPLGKTHSFFKTQGRGSPPPRACSGSCRLGTSSAPADPGLPRPGPLPSLLLCVCVPGNEMLPQPENQDRFKLLSWGPTPAAAFSWRAAPELRACQLSPDPRWLWPAGGHASSVIASLLSVNRPYFLLGRLTPNLPCMRYGGGGGARPAC